MAKSLSNNAVRCHYCGSNKHKINSCGKDFLQIHKACQTIHDGILGKKQITRELHSVSRLNLFRIVSYLKWSRDLPTGLTSNRVKHDSTRTTIMKTILNVHHFYRAKYLDKHQEKCPVCLEKFSKTLVPVRTKCGHDFCLSCYTTTVATSGRRASCPMCRNSLLR